MELWVINFQSRHELLIFSKPSLYLLSTFGFVLIVKFPPLFLPLSLSLTAPLFSVYADLSYGFVQMQFSLSHCGSVVVVVSFMASGSHTLWGLLTAFLRS